MGVPAAHHLALVLKWVFLMTRKGFAQSPRLAKPFFLTQHTHRQSGC